MIKDEAFQQYEEEIARINQEARKAKEVVRAIFHEQAKAIQTRLHEELKTARAFEQKTKERSR